LLKRKKENPDTLSRPAWHQCWTRTITQHTPATSLINPEQSHFTFFRP